MRTGLRQKYSYFSQVDSIYRARNAHLEQRIDKMKTAQNYLEEANAVVPSMSVEDGIAAWFRRCGVC